MHAKRGRRQFLGVGGATLISARRSNAGQPQTNSWRCVYALDHRRQLAAGSAADLADAIRRAADLRICTEFRHNEHIDTSSDDADLIREVADFRVTYLLGNQWVAGIINLRQPISLPDGFGARPSMSFFLYNQDGGQAIARPHLDGRPASGKPGTAPLDDHSAMPKYHQRDNWDAGTNAPSSNFVYDFDSYRFLVNDTWTEVLSHDSSGATLSGSVETLANEFALGRELKVAVRGLCSDLAPAGKAPAVHEVFVHVGSCYYYTRRKLFMAGSHPLVRVMPAIPLQYRSRAWDFGWLMPRTDGFVARWLVDPYTLKFKKSEGRYAMRWFVR
jgi:hypothetical protein